MGSRGFVRSLGGDHLMGTACSQHEGILGTIFTGKLVEEIVLKSENGEDIKAVVPEITGEAWVTQYSQVVVDPTDPFGCGYRVGDIWSGGKVTPNNHTNMANF